MFISDAEIVLDPVRLRWWSGSPSALTEEIGKHYSNQLRRWSLTLMMRSSLFKTDLSSAFFDSVFGGPQMNQAERRKQARRLQQQLEKERALHGSILM